MAINTAEVEVLLNAKLNASNAVSGISDIQKAMRNLTLPKGISADLEKSFSKLTPLLKDYQKQLDKGFSSQKDIKNFNLLKEKIDSVFGDIKSKVQEVNGQEIRLKVDTKAIEALQNNIVKTQADLENALQNVFKKNQSAASIETKFSSLEKAIPKNWSKVQEMLSGASTSFKAGNFAEFNRELQKTSDYIQNLKSTTQIDLAHKLGMSKAKTDLADAQTHLNNFFNSLKTNIREANKVEELRAKLAEMGVELENLNISSVEDGPKAFEAWVQSITGTTSALDKLHTSTQETANGMVRMVDEVNELKRSTQYFFSLRNMINLLKQGVRDAVESIKELDKAMTDTAVVTDFNVADMWRDLPKYTQLANQLGATTQGAYETMTLYYQQGLNQQQAFALGAETMKMARIAGLDYAETTDMMTAALRGFNMELDEVSAKRVNDVYSELAAITASDTEEIGSAMQRTASIAHSAGMSFEGTSAFLAQAIETTREAPENIGTAMKTIVARFQEMKKNPLEITEVDGEEVNYNKIDEALKTIGVDLKDTNGQFRELDQVFLDISSRWDTLTQTQQRYIATTAAGSRQQSRFIAMMDNYDRTVQLMEAARNSAGASDEQFNKTMDSLEAKINKFQNAWKEFTMGLANDKMVKGVIDALTMGLGTVNKIITAISKNPLSKALGIEGGTKSVLSLVAAFSGIKAFGRIANAGVGALGGLVDPQSTWKEGWKQGLTGLKGNKDYKNITNPIVQAINGLIPHIDKEVIGDTPYKYQGNGDYKNARTMLQQHFKDNKGQYSLTNLTDIFNRNELNKQQQAQFFKASPGLRKSVSKQLANIYKEAGTDPKVTKGLISGFQNGSLALDEALAHDSLTEPLLDRCKKIGGPAGQAFKEQFVNQFKREKGAEGLQGDALGAYINKRLKETKVPIKQVQELMDTMSQRGTFETVQDGLGKIGAGLMSAGSTLQMFGSTLSATNPVLGEFVSGLGGALTSVGSLASTISSLANPLVLAAAAVGTLIYVENRRLQGIQDAAKEVTKTFEETNKTTQENISTLKAYRNELATLSKGVDINGNNVNLSDADYERYLQIVDDIAAINPDIVQGYNAQGHAIIDNNNALADTLTKLEQIQKTTLKDYIDTDSLQKLIDARNINADYTSHAIREISATGRANGTATGGFTYNGKTYGGSTMPSVKHLKSPLAGSVLEVTKELEKENWFNQEFLDKYNINLENLKNGEELSIRQFINHREEIYNDAVNKFVEQNQEVSEALTTSFEDLNVDKEALDVAIQPVLQNLQTYVSNNSAFKNVSSEFQSSLMSGLKDIAIQPDLDATQMQAQARTLIQQFDSLTAEGSEYANAMEEVKIAQDQFASSLDASEYAENTKDALATLNTLLGQYKNNTTAYGQAVTEYLTTQIDKITKFTKEGTISLTEALNTATDEIAAAEGALEGFNEATKTDYTTASEGMKSIYDKAFETYKDSFGTEYEKHTEGSGDNTFWQAAQAMLSDKALSGGVDEVAKRMKKLEPMLREGQEGFEHFYDTVVNNDALKELEKQGKISLLKSGWFDEIPDEQYKAVADALGISEEMLTSMLNKARQFDAISFTNLKDVRTALATGNTAIEGIKSNNSGKALYVKDETIRAQLFDAGYHTKESQNSVLKDLKEQQNIHTVKTLDNLSENSAKKLVKAWGVQDLPELMKKMVETGEYNKEEILDLAHKSEMDEGILNPSQVYDEVVQSFENPELVKQTSVLETIDNRLATLISGDIEEQEKAQQVFREEIYGKENEKTAYENFAVGKNAEGHALDSGEYIQTKKNIEDAISIAQKHAEIQKQLASESYGEEKDRHTAMAEMYEEDLANLQKWLENGEQAWENAKRRQKESDEKKTEAIKQRKGKKEAQDYYEKYGGFRNAGSIERKEINWGSNPKKNPNFQAATTWYEGKSDKEVANSLKNSTSTYLSAAETFQDKNNKNFTLAFTPILGQTGEMLDSDTVHKYLEQAISKATDKQGKVDFKKLFEIDKKGLEIEGKEISNLLMGSFTGENQVEAAKAFTELEHDAEETKTYIQKRKKEIDAIKAKTLQKNPSKPSTKDVPKDTTTIHKEITEEDKTITQHIVTDVETSEEYGKFHQELAKMNQDLVVVRILTEVTGSPKEELQPEIDAINEQLDKPFLVQTKADLSGIDTANRAIGVLPKNKTINIKAEDKTGSIFSIIETKIERLINKGKQIKAGESRYGHNNTIRISSLPTFASAAKGKGTVGPKNKGGLTLTGEEGFEIAWLPSEGRSMILGTNGPQMLNLPNDAVVYTHEQSKNILKQKSIPAGSHAFTRGKEPIIKDRYGSSSASSTIAIKEKEKSKSSEKAAKETIKITQKAGKVLVWWENMGRRVDKVQHDADKNQKSLDRLLKVFGTTAEDYKKAGEVLIKNLNTSINLASQRKARAESELGTTINGPGTKKMTEAEKKSAAAAKKRLDAAKADYKKAKKTKGTKDDKKAKKALDKAQKKYNNNKAVQKQKENNRLNQYAEAIGARQTISYEVTETKKNKKGKKTKTKKTKNKTINLSKYYKWNKEAGMYEINQAAIDKEAGKNKSLAEAIKQATDKQLSDLYSKIQSAEDDETKATEELAEFYNSVYDTFYGWEKTITEAYLLSQKLQEISSFRDINNAVEELEFAKLEAGFGNLQTGLLKVNEVLEQHRQSMLEQVQANALLVDARHAEYLAALSNEKEMADFLANSDSENAANALDAKNLTLSFLKEIGQSENFDYQAAVNALNSRSWNKDDYDKIQEGLDNIADKQSSYYDAIAQTYQSMTEVYQTIEEYQSYMADFESSLISGLEEQANKEIDKLSKINSSIDNAAKDLIDEVKRKLDERRKQEDNAKTEQDIAQKQQRLAALRADTSGGHQVEIAQLEKEIAEAQQSYGRTLEDQLLDRLSQQQDEASKQRERQISLLEAQRDLASALGTNVEEVNKWLQAPEQNYDKVRAAWLENQGYNDKGAQERKQLEEQFDSAWLRFLAYGTALPKLEEIVQDGSLSEKPPVLSPVESINKKMDDVITVLKGERNNQPITTGQYSISDLKNDEEGKSRSVKEIKQILESNGQTVTTKDFTNEGFDIAEVMKAFSVSELHNEGYKVNDLTKYKSLEELSKSYNAQEFGQGGVAYSNAKKYFGLDKLVDSEIEEYVTQANADIAKQSAIKAYNAKIAEVAKDKKLTADELKQVQEVASKAGYGPRTFLQALANTSQLTWTDVIKAAKSAGWNKYRMAKSFNSSAFKKGFENVYGKGQYAKILDKAKEKKKTAYAYKTGGLADYTGPAWLDGSPSKPELVLNSKDTKNFIALKDVLSHAMSSANHIENSYGGDATYEININVDHLNNDYDVDKVVERVKKKIVQDSGYRNVTQVRKFR